MTFQEEINADINWRLGELATAKTFPLRYNLSQNHKDFFIKYTVPTIYAIWEGYVTTIFRRMITEINNKNLLASSISLNLLTHAITSQDKLKLENPRTGFIAKKEFIDFFQNYVSQPITISHSIPTNSNINFGTINDLLMRFNLNELPMEYKPRLDKLLRFRNCVAHGDNSIPVTKDDIEEFTLLVNELIFEVFQRVNDGLNNGAFLRSI